MNFFLAKHNHHLLGLPLSLYTFSTSLAAVSWRICCKYCLILSENFYNL
ncbi:GSCOCG00005005001-RA-CDS [Cotesia congregata]|nr:GSCOCG00005005001-RA-CDS [Cotesia congregata]